MRKKSLYRTAASFAIFGHLIIFSDGAYSATQNQKKETLSRLLSGISLEVSLRYFKSQKISQLYPNYENAIEVAKDGLIKSQFSDTEATCVIDQLKDPRNSGVATNAQLERDILHPAQGMLNYANYAGEVLEEGKEKHSGVDLVLFGDVEKTDFFNRVEEMTKAMSEIKKENQVMVQKLSAACLKP